MSSELARFASIFGNGVLLQLNLAFYLPSVPLLLLQAALDRRIDARFGHLPSNLVRVTAGEWKQFERQNASIQNASRHADHCNGW